MEPGVASMDFITGKAIADTILSVASSIFTHKGKTQEVHANRRNQVAEYFLNISRTINQAADEIEQFGRPSGCCESLRIFAERLPDTIKDFVPVEEAYEYGDRLMAAYSLEHVADNSTREERDMIISELRGASGIFLALGYDIKARR